MRRAAIYSFGLLFSLGLLSITIERSKLKIDDVQTTVSKSSDGSLRKKSNEDRFEVDVSISDKNNASQSRVEDDPGEDEDKSSYSSLLPKKIISVIGLESSGTRFVTSILAKAHGIPEYREGSFSSDGMKDGLLVQHFSLPWGSTCQAHPQHLIQNVVLPGRCSMRYDLLSPTCKEMARDANMTLSRKGNDIYPQRYNLDIVASKEWYESKGVEQVFVIVLRDQSISAESRLGHCNNQTLKDEEEDIGTEIIVRAINKYVMGGGRRLSASSYESWYKEMFWEETNDINDNDNNLDDGGHRKLSALPSGNNVFLVSYESLLKLKEVYVKMMYEALDIESDFMPSFKDGNAKYVKVTTPSRPEVKTGNKNVNWPAGGGKPPK
mmetsp:Transcript_8850/g.18375  ORF Transcript_8850/g.18375 Transcript_8850/m.18375 type:complete len:380 (+) Transcript_8850:67-1206(+)